MTTHQAPASTFERVWQRLPLIVFLVIFAFNLAAFASRWNRLTSKFTRPDMCTRDFVSLYVIGKSAWAGTNPYLPIPELETQWATAMGNCHSGFPHASPHPPVLAVICAPMGLVSYDTAIFCWLAFQAILLTIAIVLIWRWWGSKLQWWEKAILAAAFIMSGPMVSELRTGQVNSLLVVLLLCSWLALRAQREISGGAWLGLSIAVKLMGWPILLYLAVTRRWQATLSALAVFCLTNLAAAGVLGFSTVKDYFLKVGPAVTQYYSRNTASISAWTVGQRLFGASSPSLAKFVAVLLPLGLTLLVLYFAQRAVTFDLAFALLLTVSLLVNPVAWSHYVVLLVIPINTIARHLRHAAYPKHLLLSGLALYLISLHLTATAIIGLICLLLSLDRFLSQKTDELPPLTEATIA